MKYRQAKPGRRASNDERRASERMLSRIARVAFGALTGKTISPHLAALLSQDRRLLIAGNTGKYSVTTEQQNAANERLRQFLSDYQPNDRRERQDVIKLRALLYGDYQAVHTESRGLPGLSEVLGSESPLTWLNVSDEGYAGGVSEHGELTLLGEIIAEMSENRRGPGDTRTTYIGGKKCPCQACQWVYDAFNEHIGPRWGYRVAASGTHGGLFPGWIMPTWLYDFEEAYGEVIGKARGVGWDFKLQEAGFVLVPPPGEDMWRGNQDPENSESEWEKTEEEEGEIEEGEEVSD